MYLKIKLGRGRGVTRVETRYSDGKKVLDRVAVSSETIADILKYFEVGERQEVFSLVMSLLLHTKLNTRSRHCLVISESSIFKLEESTMHSGLASSRNAHWQLQFPTTCWQPWDRYRPLQHQPPGRGEWECTTSYVWTFGAAQPGSTAKREREKKADRLTGV